MRNSISFEGQILTGSISSALSRCGKSGCACKADPPRLHGPYYRWTGFLDGKRTTVTISRSHVVECRRRIANYRKLQKAIDRVVHKAQNSAPWKSEGKQ